MAMNTEIKKEATAEGMKLTHPSGVISLLTTEQLQRMKDLNLEEISRLQGMIARLDANIAAVQAAKTSHAGS